MSTAIATKYEAVIGLEIHVQLLTTSKMFSREKASFGDEPNANTGPVCLGMPGALPTVNREAVRIATLVGLALNCNINRWNRFARKNYFYPDLPKGYQISQHEEPIATDGFIEVDVEDAGRKRIGITRAHMEEDTGKNLHEGELGSLVDYNRSSVPLIEIVSEPDMRTSEEAKAYMKAIRELVVYLGVCAGNLEEGNLRCDANVSVRPVGQAEFGTKTEVKNVNSYRFVKQAIDYEIERQIALIESGGKVQQETRTFDPLKNETRLMRSKEEAMDYRYFPEPDLPPLILSDEFIEGVRADLPELPLAKADRFQQEYNLPEYDSKLIAGDRALASYYEQAVAAYPKGAKGIANWLMTELMAFLNADHREFSANIIPAKDMARLVELIDSGAISGKIAKSVFEEMYKGEDSPDAIVEAKGLRQISDPSALEPVIAEVLDQNAKQVGQYLDGKEQLIGFFVGQVMKRTRGQADPGLTNKMLKEALEERR